MLKNMIGVLQHKLLFFVLLIAIFHTQCIFAQQSSTNGKRIEQDSAHFHSPKRAFIYSAILPGAGQTYNKQYWKIPIVYAALGTTYYFVRWNNKNHKKYKNAYIDYKAFLAYKHQDPSLPTPIPLPEQRTYEDLILADVNDFNSQQENWFQNILLDRQGDYKRDRDLSYIILAGFYILNMIEALVSAHLLHYDISEDLSMQIQPQYECFEHNPQQIIGISICVNFK